MTNHGDGTPADTEEFVSRIVGRRLNPDGEGYQYKVRWRSRAPSEDAWLSLEELANCHDLIREYNRHIDPLPGRQEVPQLEPVISETVPPVEDRPYRPTFRSHPVRDEYAASRIQQAFRRRRSSLRGEPPARLDSQDSALVPIVDTSTGMFRAVGVDMVRPKRRGHEARVSWHDTWVAINVLDVEWRAAALLRLQQQDAATAPPLDAEWTPAPRTYSDVSEILGVRLGTLMPEVHVRWQPEWITFSNLSPALREEARALLAANMPTAAPVNEPTLTGGRVDEPTLTNGLGTAAEVVTHHAAVRIQRAYRHHLTNRRLLWFAPATFSRPDDPRAVRRNADGSYSISYAHGWLSEPALTALQRRRFQALLRALSLPAPLGIPAL